VVQADTIILELGTAARPRSLTLWQLKSGEAEYVNLR
jgi:hypothetical protein